MRKKRNNPQKTAKTEQRPHELCIGRLSITACFLFLASAFWLSKAHAVELSPQQYQQVIHDIKQIYAQDGSQKVLQLLRQEPMDNMTHYFPPEENQGVLTIKTPLKTNKINIIQIPHAFFDLHSLDIGQQMFDSEWADVLMVNTEHRYETKNSDLARLRYSLFTGMVDALKILNSQIDSENKKRIRVIQIHGYNENKRKTESAQQTDMILSNGSVIPDLYMLQVQSCLRDNAQLLARVYGRDVFELGATVNPVGKLLRRDTDHHIQFLHVELPRRIREAMVFGESGGADQKMEPQIMRQVMKCLLSR